jgi:hypothetical protein
VVNWLALLPKTPPTASVLAVAIALPVVELTDTGAVPFAEITPIPEAPMFAETFPKPMIAMVGRAV